MVAVGTLVREERFFETLPDLKAAIDGSQAAMVYYTYTRASQKVINALAETGVPCFSTPGRTARALSAAVDYAEFLRRANQVAILREADDVRVGGGGELAGPEWSALREWRAGICGAARSGIAGRASGQIGRRGGGRLRGPRRAAGGAQDPVARPGPQDRYRRRAAGAA